MATVTGWQLYSDTGPAGPSSGDGVSGGAYPQQFDSDSYPMTGTSVVYYPELGDVTGSFYLVNGTYHFVPDDPSPFPLSQPGTVQSYQASGGGGGGGGPIFGTSNSDASGDFATTSGNDTVYGGSTTSSSGTGSDTISSGDGHDLVYSGDGNDQVDAGTGNDTVHAGSGNDYVDGWTGDDAIYGGDGQDTILGYDGEDTLYGGAGNDRIDGEADADFISGDGGDDSLYGGAGADTISGGVGNDLIYGGDGADSITGDSGSDTIFGGSGNDTIYGGADDDVIGGNTGDDVLYGGTGNDTISGDEGNDALSGGDGDDVFVYFPGDGHDTITDFNTGNSGGLQDGNAGNNDRIDLSDYYDHIRELHADQADDGILNQSNDGVDGADYSDNTQFGAGSLTFQGATADESFFTQENTGVVCFVQGTRIRTPSGEVPVETLQIGDMVETLDHGPRPIRWIGRRDVTIQELQSNKRLWPVRIQKGVLGNHRTLFVSRQHALLLDEDRFARAIHLARALPGIGLRRTHRPTSYFHVLFDTHEIVFAEGIPSESFYPGKHALAMMTPGSLDGLRKALPTLPADLSDAQAVTRAYGPAARTYLTADEVKSRVPSIRACA